MVEVACRLLLVAIGLGKSRQLDRTQIDLPSQTLEYLGQSCRIQKIHRCYQPKTEFSSSDLNVANMVQKSKKSLKMADRKQPKRMNSLINMDQSNTVLKANEKLSPGHIDIFSNLEQ